MTLTELMIATALISIGVLVSVAAFKGIFGSIQYSKQRTLAANIVQEKMGIIMQKSYYEVLVTTNPAFKVETSSTIPYDTSYFPPETFTEGGTSFTRYTYIQVVQETLVNGVNVIQSLSPDTPDTGMRQISETVIWPTTTGDRYLTIQNVLNNPNTVMSDVVISGVVYDSVTLHTISNVLVDAAENVGWRDTTNSSGHYTFHLSPGTFDFLASAAGYFSQIITLSVAPGNSLSQNFYLIPMSSGTISGMVWVNNHVVISQVVASTGPSNGMEYIELYNPTTAPIYIGDATHNGNGGNPAPTYWPVLWDANGTASIRHIVYVSSTVPSNGFYLISNTYPGSGTTCSAMTVAGITVNPDACWLFVSNPQHTIQAGSPVPSASPQGGPSVPDAGGVSLISQSGIDSQGGTLLSNWQAFVIDSIGWSDTALGHPAPTNAVQGTGLTNPSGMQNGEDYVRRLDTGTAWNSALGNAYDSNNDSVDFLDYNPVPFNARTTANIAAPKTGVPAVGAIASATDGLSVPSSATLTGNPPYAQFSIVGVATGTCIVFIDSTPYSSEIDTVSITGNTTTYVPNATTVPVWAFPGYYSTVLSGNGITGMISGVVQNSAGSALSGIPVTAGGYSTTTSGNGTYYLRMSTGIYDVTANTGNTANTLYASWTQSGINVPLADVTSNVNFTLAQGGKASGWITRDGTNPLPGVTVVGLDANGDARDSEVSANNGYFLLINLTTGPYTVEPVLDPKEAATPSSATVTVTAGNTVWSSSFTVSGALGAVTGNVTYKSNPIKSGVLIVISTSTVTAPPPALSSASLTGAAFYADSSREDGTFSVSVRGSTSTTYNVSAFYMYMNNTTPVISTQTTGGVTVTAGQTTSGVNFAW